MTWTILPSILGKVVDIRMHSGLHWDGKVLHMTPEVLTLHSAMSDRRAYLDVAAIESILLPSDAAGKGEDHAD